MTQTQIPLQLRYTPPGAAAPTDRLLVTDPDKLERALAILDGTATTPEETAPLPATAEQFVKELNFVHGLLLAVASAAEQAGLGNIDPANPPCSLPSLPLAYLRSIGSGPKQVAALLGCETGYFDQGDETVCVFAPLRFLPAPGFFDMRA